MIKCIIFDCDGTLVDSEYLCNLGLEIKLREYGTGATANDLMTQFRGDKFANTLAALEREHQLTFSDDFIPTYRQIVDDLFTQQLQPCPGAHDMLLEIDLPKCIASNGPSAKMQHSLSVTGLANHFGDNIFSAYTIGSWKPDPGLFLHAARAMGFQPDECAVVEDSAVGITAAEAAGMVSVLYDPEGIHDAVKCTHRIHHLNELKAALV